MKEFSLAYIVCESNRLDEWEHFAVDLMGMQLADKAADQIRFRNDGKSYRWLVRKGAAEDLYAIGLELSSGAELDALIRKLRDAGHEVTEADAGLTSDRQVDRLASVKDPMGNWVELVVGHADAPADFKSGQLLGEFVTGDGGAGHVVLASGDVPRETYLAFYEGLLGFQVSDRIIQEFAPGITADLAFLHCNQRHHSLAIGNVPIPHKIHHFMLEVSDFRDVGAAYDRCLEAGQPMEMTIGMHPNDDMFSFYVRTPTGFSVEYGWGGLLVDPDTWTPKQYDHLDIWGHHDPQKLVELLNKANSPEGD